jgi:hypothetical protein
MNWLNIGIMNLKTKLFILFFAITFQVNSQEKNYPQIIILKGDTIIGFTKKQVQRITEINEENKSCSLQLLNKDSVINMNKKMFIECDSIYSKSILLNKKYIGIIDDKNIQINTYIKNEERLKTEIETQKKYKNYSLIGCGVLILVNYLILSIK